MDETNQFIVPRGLPASLCSSNGGFERLCEFLTIETRAQKQGILSAPFVKRVFERIGYKTPAKAKQSERIRRGLTAFYSDPHARRNLWRSRLEEEENLNPNSAPIPSFEYEALRALDESLIATELDVKETKEITDFCSSDAVRDEWRHAAIVALDQIKEDIPNWEELPDDRKSDLLYGAFAVATILDDIRLLQWLINHVEIANEEYLFLSISELEGDAPNNTVSVPITDILEEEQSILDRLKTEAHRLSAAALELSTSQPSQDLFDDVANHAENVAELREPAIKHLESSTSIGKFQFFTKQVQEKSEHLTWLAEHRDEILNLWKESYDLEQPDESERLVEDLDRATIDLAEGVTRWFALDQEFSQVEEALRQTQLTGSEPGALQPTREMFELTQRLGELGQERWDLQDQVLTSIRPTEQPIEQPASDPADPPKDNEGNLHGKQGLDIQSDSEGETEEESTVAPEQPDDAPSKSTATTDDLAIWQALDCGRLGNAYHIARLDEEAREGRVQPPSSDLLALLTIGSVIQNHGHQLVLDYGRRISSVLSSLDLGKLDPETRDALSLLLLSATIRPALFVGQDDAITLLKRVELSSSLSPVYSFSDAMAKHAVQLKHIQLDGSALSAVLDEDVWRDRWDRHIAKVEHWKGSAIPKFFGYKPIREVWRHWIGPKGRLFRLGELISKDSEDSAIQVEKLLEEFTTGTLQDLVNNTWRNELDKKGGNLSGKVLLHVQRHLNEPVRLAQDWLRLIRSKPQGRADWVQTAIERLRNDMQSYGKTALDAVHKRQSSNPDIRLRAALGLAETAIASAEAILLHPGETNGNVYGRESDLLSRELVLVKDLALNNQGEIDKKTSSSSARKLLTSFEDYASDPIDAFNLRLQQNDLCGARAAWKYLEYQSEPRASEFLKILDVEFLKKTRELHRRLDDFTEKLEPLFIVGEVPVDKYLTLNSQVETARKMIETGDNDNVLDALVIVENSEAKLADIETATIAKFENRIPEYTDTLSKTDITLLREALENKDLIALHEYIDCIQEDRPLVSSQIEKCRSLKQFLSLVDQIDQQGSPNGMAVLDAIRTSDKANGFDYSVLSDTQTAQSTSLVEAWLLMDRLQTKNDSALVQLIQGLGFESVAISAEQNSSDSVVEVKAMPLRDRELCPVHFYGSEAGGKYNLILNWSPDAQSSIIQAVRSNANSHIIVLHFGHISREERWQLRSWSIRNSIQFIVIDETLLFFLASVASRRLRSLFDCTLPFTCIEPFFTAAGLMPPESFYGRDSERRKILDRYGSCFVYGGRQLGKTALLRSAEKAFHSPEERQIAICIDLKQHGVGLGSNAEYIWTVLVRQLIQHDMISASFTIPRQRERLVEVLREHISNWVSDENDGRILLLLDEADAFLAEDLRNNFKESITLKGFMDDTDRKFKVVLCGLHNVLRSTERANHPLAHFGEPICVGAFLTDGEREQAHALVREPLAAAGFVFENHGLVYHILARTNYYPSLIQIYGENLVRHIRSSITSDIPCVIRQRDLDAVFGSEKISERIKDRFALTLQLDERYEVIAYALAHELHVDPTGTERFSAREVLDLARVHWSEGFAISLLEFETLLREMHGLGVLRQYVNDDASSVKYAFRNPNVRLLLGNSEHVVGVLEKDRVPQEVFEAAHYHAQYPEEDATSPRRGPLTFEQEALLKRGGRVAVLCGTAMAKLYECREFLSQRMDTDLFRNLDSCQSAEELARAFTGLRPRYATVCMVNDEDPYTIRWIENAVTRIRNTSVGDRLRVVFVASANQLWNLLEDIQDSKLTESLTSRLDWIHVQSWSKSYLLQWCKDQNFQEAVTNVDELFELTGGWPTLLEEYAKLNAPGWHEKRQRLEDYIEENEEQLALELGLNSRQCVMQMKTLSELGNLAHEEISEYEELLIEDNQVAIQPGSLHRRLLWAIRSGLIEDHEGEIRLNPLVNRLVFRSEQ